MQEWLTLPEVVDRIGVGSKHTIRTLVRQGRLPAYQFTRRLLFRPEDVDQLVQDCQVERADGAR